MTNATTNLHNTNEQSITLIHHDDPISWAKLCRSVTAWQTTFSARQETHWALYFKDTNDFLAALLGAWMANKVVFLPSDALPATAEALSQLVDGFVGDYPDSLQAPILDHTSATDNHLSDLFIPTTATAVFFTSGSTGSPKPIVKTMAQLLLEISALQQQFGTLFQNTTVYATVSHQHFYGFIFRVLLPLFQQQPLSSHTIKHPENLLSLQTNAEIILISSPAFLSRVNESANWQGLVSFKAIFSAGGALKSEFSKKIEQHWHTTPIEIYGSTETGAVAFKQHHDNFQLLPSNTITLSTEGLLCVHNPYVTADNQTFTTSDMATLEQNGSFSLQGRADRLIKLEEKRISLTQIERILNANPLISQAHVLPVEGKRLTLGTVIELTPQGQQELDIKGRRLFIESLTLPLKRAIEHFAIPKRWRFAASIPLNPQGKAALHTLNTLLMTPLKPTIFPNIVACTHTDKQVTLELHIPLNLLYFQGHFNQQAILPGVVQVEWARHYALKYFSDYLSNEHFPHQVKKLKFQKVTTSNMMITLLMNYSVENSELAFEYTSSEEGPHSSGLIMWSKHERTSH